MLKRLDITKAFLMGLKATIELKTGLKHTYKWALNNNLDQRSV